MTDVDFRVGFSARDERKAITRRTQPEPVDVDEIVRELAEIRIGSETALASDPGLNLFAGICKKPLRSSGA